MRLCGFDPSERSERTFCGQNRLNNEIMGRHICPIPPKVRIESPTQMHVRIARQGYGVRLSFKNCELGALEHIAFRLQKSFKLRFEYGGHHFGRGITDHDHVPALRIFTNDKIEHRILLIKKERVVDGRVDPVMPGLFSRLEEHQDVVLAVEGKLILKLDMYKNGPRMAVRLRAKRIGIATGNQPMRALPLTLELQHVHGGFLSEGAPGDYLNVTGDP
jgi:hypothetical protein